MVDITPVPDRLKDSVGKAEGQNILNGFFAQIMVDAVNLLFLGDLQELLVQRLRRLQIVPEGLLDDHAPPVLAVFIHESDFCKVLDNTSEEAGGSGKIEEVVAVRGVVFIDLLEKILELAVDL
jgi:hypothetical protein